MKDPCKGHLVGKKLGYSSFFPLTVTIVTITASLQYTLFLLRRVLLLLLVWNCDLLFTLGSAVTVTIFINLLFLIFGRAQCLLHVLVPPPYLILHIEAYAWG